MYGLMQYQINNDILSINLVRAKRTGKNLLYASPNSTTIKNTPAEAGVF